jgi:phosphohistidine phosphatase
MRHGPAEDESTTGRDFDRALSEQGRVRVVEAATTLARRGDLPVRIVSSPLVRAVQTAGIVAKTLGIVAELEIRPELAPSSEDGVSLVHELVSSGDRAVLVVGHAPDVSLLIYALTGLPMGSFSAGMIVALDMTGRSGARQFVIDATSH